MTTTAEITPEMAKALSETRDRDHMVRHAGFVCGFADEISGAYNVQVTPYDVVVMAHEGNIDAAFKRFGIDKTVTPHREHSNNGRVFRAWRGTFNMVSVELVEVTKV